MDFKDSKSYKNIQESFFNESKAIVYYYICADMAKNQGQIEVAEFFEKMAKNELEHAKTWFKYLHDVSEDTLENLKNAADTENDEWKNSYPQAALTAKEEGFFDVANMFERISSIECDHERRFVEMLLSLGEKVDIKKENSTKKDTHFCLFCGLPSEEQLEICPVCGAKDSFIVENN